MQCWESAATWRPTKDPALTYQKPQWRTTCASVAKALAASICSAAPRKDRCSPFAWPAACGDGKNLEVYVALVRELEALELSDEDTDDAVCAVRRLLRDAPFQVSSVTWRPLVVTALRFDLLCSARHGVDTTRAAELLQLSVEEWWPEARWRHAYETFAQHHTSTMFTIGKRQYFRKTKSPSFGSSTWGGSTTCTTLSAVPELDEEAPGAVPELDEEGDDSCETELAGDPSQLRLECSEAEDGEEYCSI